MTVWVLIIFLTTSYKGGVVALPLYNSEANCQVALQQAKKIDDFEDGGCIQAENKP